MKRARYICSICHEEFTRKYNGERHNNNLHVSHARIISLRRFRYGVEERNQKSKKLGFSSSTKELNKEELLSDILESIGKEFEDCENILSSLPPQDKAMSLAQIVVHSLRTEEPKQQMRAFLKGFRMHKLKEKIIKYVATGFDISPHEAQVMLISTLK
jgi:hypothetical protein